MRRILVGINPSTRLRINKKGAFVCWHNLLSPGKPKYHRPCALSLLCSEWEEVGHTQVEHQQTKDPFYIHPHTNVRAVSFEALK